MTTETDSLAAKKVFSIGMSGAKQRISGRFAAAGSIQQSLGVYPKVEIRAYGSGFEKDIVSPRKARNSVNKLMNNKQPFNKDKAVNAIKNTSFEKLQTLEKQYGFSEAVTKKGTKEKLRFFNLGKANNYQNILSKNLINKMNNEYKKELEKYNYE